MFGYRFSDVPNADVSPPSIDSSRLLRVKSYDRSSVLRLDEAFGDRAERSFRLVLQNFQFDRSDSKRREVGDEVFARRGNLDRETQRHSGENSRT